MKLTELQAEALRRASAFTSFLDPKQIGTGMNFPHGHPLQRSYRIWNQLADLGLVQSFHNSEQVRGERRTYYTEFLITPAGRAALEPKP